MSRRRLIGLGIAAGLGVTALATSACSPDAPWLPGPPGATRERPACVPRSALPRFDRLAGLPLIYEVTRRRSEFAIESGFAHQLEAWLADLVRLTGWAAEQLRTYGAWTKGGETSGAQTSGAGACSSWHNAGRAFDLARIRLADGTDVSCRYDLWRAHSGSELVRSRRVYWSVAASAHKHFAYVLTYLYNAEHHNHIHLDNGRSGASWSTFSSRSVAQVQAVQGICRHLWNSRDEPSGCWDSSTQESVGRVLADLDLGNDLADPAAWHGFLDASARRGAEPA